MSSQLLPQSTNASVLPNITLNNLNKLLIGVTIAQSRGTYSFDESADLAEPVKSISEFIRFYSNTIQKEQEEKQKAEEQAQAQSQDQNIINAKREEINLTDLH